MPSDTERAVHELLRLGARLAGFASGTANLAELEGRVTQHLTALAEATESTITAGLTTLSKRSEEIFASDAGELAGVLRAWRTELDRHLGEMFDPDRKRSVIASMEKALAEVLDAHACRLAAANDPNSPDTPAGRLLAELRATASAVRSELAALTLAVGNDHGRAAAHQLTAVKGLEFEELVFKVVTAISAPHGDIAERVGSTRGANGTRNGDIRVSLCENDDPGGVGQCIIEAKDRRLSLSAAWRELDAAMANWEASAGIVVFASGEAAPSDLPFWYSGDRAIVVLERDDPDPAALALACLFARWVVRRRRAPGGSGPDAERIAAGIDRIQRALARVSSIRRSLSTSTKATAEARDHLDTLAGEVREALGELSTELQG